MSACHSKPTVQYGGTYAYGDPQDSYRQVDIYPESDTTLLFHLYISRGAPSYNNGEIEGRLTVRDNKATFRKHFDPGLSACELQFEFFGDSVHISMPGNGCDCGFGYGVCADGAYLRLSAEIPQFFTTVSGDKIYFDQWQEQEQQPTVSSYPRIDAAFTANFPDYVPGMPLERGKLLPQGIAEESLPDLYDEYTRVYVVGKIFGYKGLDLFICELDATSPDEEAYDNHMDNNIVMLVYDKAGFALEFAGGEEKAAGRAMHMLRAHYYGEGGEWLLDSSFAKDTTLLCCFNNSESESATGYQTPLVRSERHRSVITPSGNMETLEILERTYSSPFYDCEFLSAQNWSGVEDEGFNRDYPTRSHNWQLTNDASDIFPVNVFFHIERIDGALTPVFSTSESDDSQILSRYAVGGSDNDATQTDAAPAPNVALIKTSDGDLGVLSDGKFVLYRR